MGNATPLAHERDRLAAAIGGRSELTPGAEDQLSLIDDAKQSLAIGRVAYGIAGGIERRGMGRPQAKEIGDEQSGMAPRLGEADAATNGRVVMAFIGGGRIEHDEGAESTAVEPPSFQTVAIGRSRCHSIGFYREWVSEARPVEGCAFCRPFATQA